MNFHRTTRNPQLSTKITSSHPFNKVAIKNLISKWSLQSRIRQLGAQLWHKFRFAFDQLVTNPVTDLSKTTPFSLINKTEISTGCERKTDKNSASNPNILQLLWNSTWSIRLPLFRQLDFTEKNTPTRGFRYPNIIACTITNENSLTDRHTGSLSNVANYFAAKYQTLQNTNLLWLRNYISSHFFLVLESWTS